MTKLYNTYKPPHAIMNRLHKISRGLESIIEGLSCDAVRMGWVVHVDGEHTFHFFVRWWNPAVWLAWFRTAVLKDRFGSAFYCKQKVEQ